MFVESSGEEVVEEALAGGLEFVNDALGAFDGAVQRVEDLRNPPLLRQRGSQE
ncbi:hypothetical protein GCM10008019_08380 [Deinococcus soli (ex Cha et al. 2016)]|nr:hypothetical protein GCM10008019_08380 [Deinococcus soli (ex Cha et al. 2016)]